MLNQAQREQLGEVLAAVEGKAVRLYLEDSEAFDVTIVSSARAKAGGDIVGTVIWAISTTNPDAFDTGSTLHFSLSDVVKMEDLKSGQCLFDRGDGTC